MVKALLRAGAQVDIKDNNNKTALDLATQQNKSEVVRILQGPQQWQKM